MTFYMTWSSELCVQCTLLFKRYSVSYCLYAHWKYVNYLCLKIVINSSSTHNIQQVESSVKVEKYMHDKHFVTPYTSQVKAWWQDFRNLKLLPHFLIYPCLCLYYTTCLNSYCTYQQVENERESRNLLIKF